MYYVCTYCKSKFAKVNPPAWLCRCGKPLSVHYNWEGKEYEMRVVDEFEITNKPVLFRTGIWHAVQKSDTKRTMLSFSARYGIDWDTFVNCWKDSGLLNER